MQVDNAPAHYKYEQSIYKLFLNHEQGSDQVLVKSFN